MAGIRYADLRGYSYDRTDVTGRGLANAYAQLLGTIFSSGGEKPYEVEIFVAELGATSAQDQIYRLTYDGSVADEAGFAVMGGSADVDRRGGPARVRAGAEPGRRDQARGRRPRIATAARKRAADAGGGVARGGRSWTATGCCRASSAGSPADRLAALLADEVEPADPGTEAPIQVPAEPTVPETTVGNAADSDNPVDAAPASPENPSP